MLKNRQLKFDQQIKKNFKLKNYTRKYASQTLEIPFLKSLREHFSRNCNKLFLIYRLKKYTWKK